MSTVLTSTIQNNIENEILDTLTASPFFINLTGSLRPIIKQIAGNLAPDIVNTVSTTSNAKLDEINANILGPINPFDLVVGNLGSKGLANNLSPSVLSELYSPVSNKTYNSIYGTLSLTFPDLFSNPAISLLVSALISSLSQRIVTTQLPVAVNAYTDSVFNSRTGPPPTYLGSSANFESIFLQDEEGDETTEKLADVLTDKYLQEALNFDINNKENEEKLIANKLGFIDPEAKYPSKEYAGEPETNKLAQGDIRGTVVQKKNEDRLQGAKLPGGESFDQPIAPYKSQYPYNKVTETENGHVIEVDDTPGSERLHVYHKSGTFIEIDNTGSMVVRSVGSKYEIIDRNGKIAIRGKADVSVAGECSIFVGNNANIEVEGNTNITCHNDTTLQTGGNAFISASENFFLTAGNVFIESRNDMCLFSTNNMYGDASLIYFNSEGGRPKEERRSKAGLLYDRERGTGRKSIKKIEISDPVALTLADTIALKLEEDEDAAQQAVQKDLVLKSGFSDSAAYDEKPIIQETSPSKNKRPSPVPPNEDIKKVATLPGNYNLSPNFTLEMLTSRAVIVGYEIQETETTTIKNNEGQSVTNTFTQKFGDIAYNLHALALNILEPAYNLYPTMMIGSAYRPKFQSSPNSIHYTGKAADLFFEGATRLEVYEIARILEQNLGYNDFILEYCSYTKNSWIHIAYDVNGTVNQPRTFYNGAFLTNGLAKIL